MRLFCHLTLFFFFFFVETTFQVFHSFKNGLIALLLNSVIFNVYYEYKEYFKYLLQIFSPYLYIVF